MSDAVDVPTPERVRLALPVAGIGYRALAYFVDAGVLFVFWSSLYFLYSLAASDVFGRWQALSGLLKALFVVALFAAQWLYWTCCEVFCSGQTLGKRALHIRVVREDGAPVAAAQSALRNLLRVVDFLPALYGVGLTSMLLTPRNRRLGDLVAGTLLVREEKVRLAKVADGIPWRDAELVGSFLSRSASLEDAARQRLALELAAKLLPLPDGETRSPEEAETLLRERFGQAG